MQRFYFDFVDGEIFHKDSYGVELDDRQEAADHAACLVRTLIHEHVSSERTQTITIMVRNTDDKVIHIAHGTLHSHTLPD